MSRAPLPNGSNTPPARGADPRAEHERQMNIVRDALRQPAAADQDVFGWLRDRAAREGERNG